MLATILFLAAFEVYFPHENWLNNQFEELCLRTEPVNLVFPNTKPYSVSELLKYVGTSTSEDPTADLLRERIEGYLKGFEGFGGNLELRSDSISRVFFSPHLRKKLNGIGMFVEVTVKVGKSNEYPDHVWEDFASGDYVRAYLKADAKRFSFLFGREHLKWGASRVCPLFLSGSNVPFDLAYASYRTDRFQFSSFFSTLSSHSDTSRYLTGHRIELRPVSRLFVGLNEIVLHGGYNTFPDPYYLNPLVVFYPREWNENRNKANILWGIDFNFTGDGWSGYGEFMVDDYPYEPTSMDEHPKLGWILGFRMVDLLRHGEYIVVEYVGVHRWCYGHKIPWQRYTNRGHPIGHPLGNDFDRISVNFTEHLGQSLDFEISADYARKGEGEISDPYPEERFPDSYFLTGVLEKRVGASIGVRYMMNSLWTIELKGRWEQINNYEHLEGASHSQPSINFKLEKLL